MTVTQPQRSSPRVDGGRGETGAPTRGAGDLSLVGIRGLSFPRSSWPGGHQNSATGWHSVRRSFRQCPYCWTCQSPRCATYHPGIAQGAHPKQCFPLSFGMSLREMLVPGHQHRCVSRAFMEQDETERNLNLQCR